MTTIYFQIQKKVFTKWINIILSTVNVSPIKDFQEGLSDGVILCKLIEILSGKAAPRKYTHNIKSSIALGFLNLENVRSTGCVPEDFADGNLNKVLSVIWQLILKYQIQKLGLTYDTPKTSVREALLNWARGQVKEYSLELKDFLSSWSDGFAFSILAFKFSNCLLDSSNFTKENSLSNLRISFAAAEEHFGIISLFDPEDMLNKYMDELSVMTYVSFFPKAYERTNKAQELVRSKRTSIMNKLDLSKIPQELLTSPRLSSPRISPSPRIIPSPRISPSPRIASTLSPPLSNNNNNNNNKYSPRPSLLQARVAVPHLSLLPQSSPSSSSSLSSPLSPLSSSLSSSLSFSLSSSSLSSSSQSTTTSTSTLSSSTQSNPDQSTIQTYQSIQNIHFSPPTRYTLTPPTQSIQLIPPSLQEYQEIDLQHSFNKPPLPLRSIPLSSVSSLQLSARPASPAPSFNDVSLLVTPANSPTLSSVPSLPFFSPNASLPSPSVLPRNASPRSLSLSPRSVSSSLSASQPSPFSSPASSPRSYSSPPSSPSPLLSPSDIENERRDNSTKEEEKEQVRMKSAVATKEVAENLLLKSSPSIPDTSNKVFEKSSKLRSVSGFESKPSITEKRSGEVSRRTVGGFTKEMLQQNKISPEETERKNSSASHDSSPLSIVRESRELVREINERIEGERQEKEDKLQDIQDDSYVPIRRSTFSSLESESRNKNNESKEISGNRMRAWTRGQLSSSSPSGHKRGNSFGVRIGNGGTTAEEQIIALKAKVEFLESRNDENLKMLDNAKYKLERAANCVHSLMRRSQDSASLLKMDTEILHEWQLKREQKLKRLQATQDENSTLKVAMDIMHEELLYAENANQQLQQHLQDMELEMEEYKNMLSQKRSEKSCDIEELKYELRLANGEKEKLQYLFEKERQEHMKLQALYDEEEKLVRELKAKLAVKSQQTVSPRSHIPRLRFDDLLRKQSPTSPRVSNETWTHVPASSPNRGESPRHDVLSPREKIKPYQKTNVRNSVSITAQKVVTPIGTIDLNDLDAIINNAKAPPDLNRMDSGHIDMHLENLINGNMRYYRSKPSPTSSPSSPHSENNYDNVSSSSSSGNTSPTYVARGMNIIAEQSGSSSSSSRGPSMSNSPSSSRSTSPGPSFSPISNSPIACFSSSSSPTIRSESLPSESSTSSLINSPKIESVRDSIYGSRSSVNSSRRKTISDGLETLAQVELIRKRSQSLVTKPSGDSFGIVNDASSDPSALNKIVQQQYEEMNARLTDLREQIGNLAAKQYGSRPQRKLQSKMSMKRRKPQHFSSLEQVRIEVNWKKRTKSFSQLSCVCLVFNNMGQVIHSQSSISKIQKNRGVLINKSKSLAHVSATTLSEDRVNENSDFVDSGIRFHTTPAQPIASTQGNILMNLSISQIPDNASSLLVLVTPEDSEAFANIAQVSFKVSTVGMFLARRDEERRREQERAGESRREEERGGERRREERGGERRREEEKGGERRRERRGEERELMIYPDKPKLDGSTFTEHNWGEWIKNMPAQASSSCDTFSVILLSKEEQSKWRIDFLCAEMSELNTDELPWDFLQNSMVVKNYLPTKLQLEKCLEEFSALQHMAENWSVPKQDNNREESGYDSDDIEVIEEEEENLSGAKAKEKRSSGEYKELIEEKLNEILKEYNIPPAVRWGGGDIYRIGNTPLPLCLIDNTLYVKLDEPVKFEDWMAKFVKKVVRMEVVRSGTFGV